MEGFRERFGTCRPQPVLLGRRQTNEPAQHQVMQCYNRPGCHKTGRGKRPTCIRRWLSYWNLTGGNMYHIKTHPARLSLVLLPKPTGHMLKWYCRVVKKMKRCGVPEISVSLSIFPWSTICSSNHMNLP